MKKYAKPDVNVLTTVFEGYLLAGTDPANNGGLNPENPAKEVSSFDSDLESDLESEEELYDSKLRKNKKY